MMSGSRVMISRWLAGQADLEGRAGAGCALKRDSSAMLLDEPRHNRQAEARPRGFRGEERIEEPFVQIDRDAGTVVRDAEQRPFHGRAAFSPPRGADLERDASRPAVEGIRGVSD